MQSAANATANTGSAATLAAAATETLAMVRESARTFASAQAGDRIPRGYRNILPGFDPRLAAAMAELGWFGLWIPEEHGGAGLGFREMAAILEETSRYLLAEPLTATSILAGRVLARAENPSLGREILPQLASGTLLPALAWQETLGVINELAIETRLSACKAGFEINGHKRFVAGAAAAGGLIVTCQAEQGLALVWVPIGQVSMTPCWRADGVPSMEIALQAVPITQEQILAMGAAAERALTAAVQEATVMVCAELVGVARRVLSMTLDYLKIREQFGRRIGSFQALQHRAVDLLVQQELAVAVTEEALTGLESGLQGIELQRLVSRAKARCSDAALRITREAIQLHGAIGYTDEHDVGLYLKRALALSAWLGNAAQHRARVARLRNGH